ncbi:MAG: hypothetical protein ACKVZ0_14485 [Gemmatimonadales bacterium]
MRPPSHPRSARRRHLASWGLLALATGCSSMAGTTIQEITVRVSNPGSGSGRVEAPSVVLMGSGTGAGCDVPANSSCTIVFDDGGGGGGFSLTAAPAPTSTFARWGGQCGSATACSLSFQDGPDVTFDIIAEFVLPSPLPFGTNLLINPGFESAVTAGPLPDGAGYWRGDLTDAIPPPTGVPASPAGGRILSFLATATATASLNTASSELFQIIDLTPLATDIDAGKVAVDGRAFFNRAPRSASSDRLFSLNLLAFAGTPASFPESWNPRTALIDRRFDLTSDADPATWETVTGSITLPPTTRYVVVLLFAGEDVVNDAVSPEFDGHYADGASLILRRLP